MEDSPDSPDSAPSSDLPVTAIRPPPTLTVTRTTEEEQEKYERDARDLANQRAKQELKLREQVATRVYMLVGFSLVACLVLVVLDGLRLAVLVPWTEVKVEVKPFEQSDTVMVSVVAAVTIEVIGLFYVIARSLFPSREPE